ncbi:MAG: hypothetical protein HZC42_08470 [Candidatus Eisenbacteria bacterium]|nr:hypothetical protein [Candidatus Eisenbacteria bacterium]
MPLCTASAAQVGPAIVPTGTGGALVAWEDYRNDAVTGADVFVQKVSAVGGARPFGWQDDGYALCTAAGAQVDVHGIPDGSGGAIFAWTDLRVGGADIYAQRVDSLGQVQWTLDGVPVSAATGTQQHSRLTGDGLGGAIIVWKDRRSGTNFNVYAQLLDASGTPQWATDGIAMTAVSNDQLGPHLVLDGFGGAIVAWDDVVPNNADIHVQRVTSAGVLSWGGSVCSASGNQDQSVICDDGLNGALIAWRDGRSLPSARDIYVQRVTSAGVIGPSGWMADGDSVCAFAGDQTDPVIAPSSAGGAVIAWLDGRNGAVSLTDVYARRVLVGGGMVVPDGGIALCTAATEQGALAITPGAHGGAIVTWEDPRNETMTHDIYAQLIRSDDAIGGGWAIDGEPACVTVGEQSQPAVTTDSSGGALICWRDDRLGGVPPFITNYDIYVQRVTSDGVPAPTADVPATGRRPVSAFESRPNPARDETEIRFGTSAPARLAVVVLDLSGRTVRQLMALQDINVGTHRIPWDLRDDSGVVVRPGVYFVALQPAGGSMRVAVVR